jgi:hypothetical protein
MEAFSHQDSFTGRIKRYPDGSMEVLACSRPVFHGPEWVKPVGGPRAVTDLEYLRSVGLEEAATEAEYARLEREAIMEGRARPKRRRGIPPTGRADARGRASMIIALCTPFTYFVTLTLNAGVIDRFNIETSPAACGCGSTTA